MAGAALGAITGDLTSRINVPDDIPDWLGAMPTSDYVRLRQRTDTARSAIDDPNLSDDEKNDALRALTLEQSMFDAKAERYRQENEKFLASGRTASQQADLDAIERTGLPLDAMPSVVRGFVQGGLSAGGNAVMLVKRLAGMDVSDDVRLLDELSAGMEAADRTIHGRLKEAGLPVWGTQALAKGARNAIASLVEMAPAAGGGAAAGLGRAGSVNLMAGQAATTTANDAWQVGIDKGWSTGGSLAYATMSGLIEGLVTKGFSRLGPSMEEGLAGIGKTTVGTTREAVVQSVMSSALEASEEVTIGALQAVTDALTGADPEALNPEKLAVNLRDQGLAGAMGGSLGSAASLAGRTKALIDLAQQVPDMPVESILGYAEGLKHEGDEPVGTSRKEFKASTGISNTNQNYREAYRAAAEAMTEFRTRITKAMEGSSSTTRTDPQEDVPPVPDGHVRFYHGGVPLKESGGGKRWLTPDIERAKHHAQGVELMYVDIPIDNPELNDLDIDGYLNETDRSNPVLRWGNFEASEELASKLRPFGKKQVGPDPEVAIEMPGPQPKQLVDGATQFDPGALEGNLQEAKSAQLLVDLEKMRRRVIEYEARNIDKTARVTVDETTPSAIDQEVEYLRTLAMDDPDMAANVLEYAQTLYEEEFNQVKVERAEYDEFLKGYTDLRRKVRQRAAQGKGYGDLPGLDEIGEFIIHYQPHLLARTGLSPQDTNPSEIAFEALQINVTEAFRLPQPHDFLSRAVWEFDEIRQRQEEPQTAGPEQEYWDRQFADGGPAPNDASPAAARGRRRKSTLNDDAEPNAPWSDLPAEGINVPAFPLQSLVQIPETELIEIVSALQGYIQAAKLKPGTRGDFSPSMMRIRIALQLGGDLQQRAKTIAHEIGHLVDMVGNKGIAADDLQSMEQNILGRIAWIAGYKEKFLAGWRGGPAPLSSADRARLRAEAERLASSTAEIEIDEEIVETTPLTPQDIKSIWNSVAPNLPKELINYVKGLSDAANRSIVMSAMKGIVPEELKRFQTTKVVGTRKVKKTVQSGGSDTEIEATLAEMIEEEIKKRQLLELDTVRKEAEGLSEWWRPYDKENASRQFADYRQSGPEIFADAISVFFNAPGEMQQRAPNLFRGIVGHMAGNPKFAKAYLELQGILQGDPADYMQRRLDAMEKSYVQGDQIIVADMNMRRRAQASLAEVLYQEGIGAALREFTDKVGPAMMAAFINRGAEVLHAQDKGKAINSQLDKILTEENNVYHSIERLMRIDSPTQAYLTELQDKVYGRLKEAGLTEDHLGQLLELRRTLVGRDNKINPRGMNYDIADKQVEHMINMLGEEKFNELHLIARDFYDLNFGIMERALESGLISKAMFEKTVVPNRYSYATYSVLQYLKSTADWSIYQVKGTFDDIGNPYRTTAEKMVSIQRAANLNAVKREVIGHLRRDLPSEVRLMTGTNLSLRPGESRLRVLVDGKQLTYAVPQQYTQLFESATNPALSTVYKNLNSLTYGIFYKLYISYNPAFALRNVGRDAFGTWHRLGAVIDGVRKQRIEESIAGGKSRAEAMKEASEPLRMRELIGLMLKPENITAARRRALGVSDPKVLELLRMSALDAGYSQTSRHAAVAMFDDEKTRDLMERAGVMPRSEAAKWQASAYEFLRKSMGQQLLDKTQHWMSILSVPKLIDTTEALMKIAGYDALKNRGFTDSQMMYMLHNVVGTQNTRYKGILHPELNGAFMFFSARIAGLRGHVIAAQASPQEYAKRSAITAGGSMLVGKLARMGAFGTFIAMMYSYIPEEEEERSFVLPLYLLQDPGDGLYKTVYLAIPRDFSDSFAATMFNVTWDAIGKQELDTGKAIAELKNATIGTLAPPWDITRVWYEYATMGDRGPIPIDSFYNRPIMSRADQMDPDHWHARRKLLAWTLRKFGAVGEWMKPVTAGLLGEDMTSGKLTPIEKMFRVPGVGALLRVSNRGMTAKMYSDAENSEGQSAQVTNMLGSQTNALRRRINTLQDVPPEKLPKEQQTLLGQALFWDKELYRPARASMLEAVKLGRDGEARQISRQLEEATRLYEEMAIAERTGDEKRALEAQRKLESFLAAP